ncbi:unnamed protein product [Citrullus colocynthis]|uniref:Uncharacterized protein n=1 Tax=Citrullus colocynthis TaxID=252529 RepID=A0ABP0XXF0_9ROSI
MELDAEIGVHEGKEKCYKEEEEICEVDKKLIINYGNVVISIKEMLKQLPPLHGESSIYRVPKQLREMNRTAYAAQAISIGPFHHNSEDYLIAGQRYKLQCLVNFLHRLNKDEALEFLVKTAQSWVEEARKWYAEAIEMKEEEFAKMMLVDGCFIVEFMMGHQNGGWNFEEQKNATLSFYKGIIPTIYLDLIKLENQVPLFVLQRLFDLIIPRSSTVDSISIIVKLANWIHIFGFLGVYGRLPDDLPRQPKHLLDLLSMYFLHFRLKKHDQKSTTFLSFFHSMCLLWQKKQDVKNTGDLTLSPPSICELREAGVTIKKANDAACINNISFKNGVLEIPHLFIDDSFEPIMRNLLAFEHFSQKMEEMYVTHYVLFMDYLISTEKDVSLLVKAGIIINEIGGSDKEVSELFNNLCKFLVWIPPNLSHFRNISHDLRQYSDGWWNKAKASLKHNYFNTPWAIISFFAATFLLLLTLLQTIFSAVSTFRPT